MFIKKLIIKNVRSIENLKLDFTDYLNPDKLIPIVIAGSNGSGKTTILEIIKDLLSVIPAKDNERKIPSFLQENSFISLLLQVEDSTIKTTHIKVGYEGTRLLLTTLGGGSSLFEKIRKLEQKEDKENESSGNIVYFPANRNYPLLTDERASIKDETPKYHWIYEYKSSDKWAGSIESYLLYLDYLGLKQKKIQPDFEYFKKLFNSFLDDKEFSHINDRLRVVIKTKDGKELYKDDLSGGEKQIFHILGDIQRFTRKNGILIIDEPEIHLNPVWQRMLMKKLRKFCKSKNIQLIVTTHSIEVFEMFMSRARIELDDVFAEQLEETNV